MDYILSKGRNAIHTNVIAVNIWRAQAQNEEEMELEEKRRSC